VLLESDFDELRAIEPTALIKHDVVATDMANANFTPSQNMLQITGVDSNDEDGNDDPRYISDDKDDHDEDEHDIMVPANKLPDCFSIRRQ